MPEVTINIPDANARPTPGVSSTENFWSGIAFVAPYLNSYAGTLTTEQAALYSMIVACLYTVCRTALKVAHIYGYARSVPDLPENPKETR